MMFGPDTKLKKLVDAGENPLQLSIKKWENIIAGKGTNEGTFNCALCIKYFDNNCNGCPVKAKTGRKECARSPYQNYKLDRIVGVEFEKITMHQLKGCKAELAFLQSLNNNESGGK